MTTDNNAAPSGLTDDQRAVLDAIRGEYLTDPTEAHGDAVYQRAVADCANAVLRLFAAAPKAAEQAPVADAAQVRAVDVLRKIVAEWDNPKYDPLVVSRLVDRARAIAAAAPAPAQQAVTLTDSGWISVEDQLPKCPRKAGSPGVEVLIHPRHVGEVTAFYGRRVTSQPNFYRYGALVNGVTHWMPLPAVPSDAALQSHSEGEAR